MNASVDDALRTLTASDASCHLDMSIGALVAGYFIRCGSNMLMAFRSERDCTVFMAMVVEKVDRDLARLAPPGTRSPARWVDWMKGCLPGAVNGAAVANDRVQSSAEYCACMAEWSGNLAGDLDVSKDEAGFKQSFTKCARERLGRTVTDEIWVAAWSLVVAAAKAQVGKAGPVPSGGNSTGEEGPRPIPSAPAPSPAAGEPPGPKG